MKLKHSNLLLGCLFFASACSKNVHDTSFEAASRLFFVHHQQTDSLVHSFANYPAVPYTDLAIPFQIMGNTATHDRVAYVEVDAQQTTALASEYELADQVIIPAGAIRGTLLVRLNNTARLQTDKVVLKLRLKPSADFSVEPVKAGKINELVEFRLIWTDVLIRPTDWPATWGGYSKTKHRLVIDLSGRSQYSGVEWTQSGLLYSVMGICNEWLVSYKQENNGQVYRDENDKEVRFCPTCN